ncbi:MAG: methylenetetrahydrofolate reductase [Muribaculaceae bacterium]|nr:methylenetetrahydrofolate reductase [Muribaculaceae bacterium]
MESVASFLAAEHPTALSFEILPPVRGGSIERTLESIRPLLEFNPAYVNITTHRTEVSYTPAGGGAYRCVTAKKRPGTVAIAAVLRERFGIRAVPHIICGDYSRGEIEDQLIDLSYLGITDVLALRGDRERAASVFTTSPDGHNHADSLCRQIEDFNKGRMVDGSEAEAPSTPFTFGVAGYPEKHEEAMNLSTDIANLKAKVDSGASYVVTQMFFDNSRYFDFVGRCRAAGITVPVIPGLKPLTSLRQMALLPRVFHIDFPDELSAALLRCTSDAEVRALGIEWAAAQARELREKGVPSIHFYSMHAVQSVAEIARRIY